MLLEYHFCRYRIYDSHEWNYEYSDIVTSLTSVSSASIYLSYRLWNSELSVPAIILVIQNLQ